LNGMYELDFVIRDARIPAEYQSIVNLWMTAGPGIHLGRSDSLEEIQKKMARDPDLFLVAESDNRIVGSVLGGFDGRRGIVYHLAVNSQYREHGIGSKLMVEPEMRLQSKSCIRSYLLVTRENKDALEFYEQRGWGKLDLIVMGKDIVR
jgi:ribosomal protein S18 acetylase RimI-like enzyme